MGGFVVEQGRLFRRLEDNLRKNFEITHPEYEVLLRLARAQRGRLRIQELAQSSLLTPSGMSRLVDRLVGSGDRREPRSGGQGIVVGEQASRATAVHFAQNDARETHLASRSTPINLGVESVFELAGDYRDIAVPLRNAVYPDGTQRSFGGQNLEQSPATDGQVPVSIEVRHCRYMLPTSSPIIRDTP